MPSLTIANVQSQLEHKFGFTPRDSKDVHFELWVGGRKLVTTKTSHAGSHKGEIGSNRQSLMARQTDMPSGNWFYKAIDCTHSKREYYEHLASEHPDCRAEILALLDDPQQ